MPANLLSTFFLQHWVLNDKLFYNLTFGYDIAAVAYGTPNFL